MNWEEKFRDISQLGFTTLFATTLTMVEGIVAAKILGPTVLGVWFTFQLILRYGGRLHLGVPNAFRRQLSVERGAGNETAITRLSDTVATFLLTVIGVQIAIISGIHLWPGFSEDLRFIALFGIVIVAFQTARSFVHPYYNGVGDFKGLSLLKLIRGGVVILTIFLTVQYHLLGFLIGRTLREIIPFLYGFNHIGYIPSISLDRQKLRRLIRIGFAIMIVSFSSQLFKTIDRIMIIWYFPSRSLGYYGTGDTFATLLLTVSSVVTNVLYTSFSKKYGADLSSAEFKTELLETMKVISYFFPIVFVNIYVFAPLVIEVLLPEYSTSVPVIRALAFGYIFFAGAKIVESVLHTFKKQRLYLVIIAVGIVVNAGLNYAVIRLGGALTGIGIATAAAYFIFFVLALGVILVFFFDGSAQLFGRATVQILVPAVVALGYALLVSDLIEITGSSLSVETAWTALKLFVAVLPLTLSFGILTLHEADVSLSRLRESVNELYS